MRKSSQLWRALEAAPAVLRLRADWEELLGEDLEALEPYLRLRSDVASVYPCPGMGGEGCPRGVVEHGPEDIVAVCRRDPRGCDDVQLSRSDIVVHQLDLQKLSAHISVLFGFSSEGSVRDRVGQPFRAFYLGFFRPTAISSIPAYFLVCHEPQGYSNGLERLAVRHSGPWIIVLPTMDLVDSASAQVLRERQVISVVLDDCLGIDGSGGLTLLEPPETLLAGLRESELQRLAKARKRAPLRFPVDPGTPWSAITMTFLDQETVEVRYLGKPTILTPGQMGMASRRNGRPTKQWILLRTFAAGEDGTIRGKGGDWPAAEVRQRQILVRILRDFFKIHSEPIVRTDDGRGWRILLKAHIAD